MGLKDKLAALIASEGPIPVSVFMTVCLHDPEAGYYATRPGLGRDFITAPETSQVFGELIGLWCVQAWRGLGRPDRFTWAELGPGRGTLMADAQRAAASQAGFLDAAQLHLVEASPALRQAQSQRLANAHPRFVGGVDALPAGPAIIIANEFLDCLPARQFVEGDDGAWYERVVGLNGDGTLTFGLAADRAPAQPHAARGAAEVQPGLDTLVAALAQRNEPFLALFIDYGPADHAPGDTLRAFMAGEQVDPLAHPGAADLTVDVDFGRLSRLAREAGLTVHGPVTQGVFLMALGIQARIDRLIAENPSQAEAVFEAAQRLVHPDGMGTRFKAICLSGPALSPDPASATSPATRRAPLPPPAGF